MSEERSGQDEQRSGASFSTEPSNYKMLSYDYNYEI